MKRFEELINRLKNDNFNTVLIEDWFNRFQRYKDFELYTLETSFNEIYGFVRGLQTLNYINSDIAELLVNELVNFYMSCS